MSAISAYLLLLVLVEASVLAARWRDRENRRAFVAGLTALHRERDEFWKLRAWVDEARARGDGEVADGLVRQAVGRIPGLQAREDELRRGNPVLAMEIGWSAGMVNPEMQAIMDSLTRVDESSWRGWLRGPRARPDAAAVMSPAVTLENDPLSVRLAQIAGGVAGAGIGALLVVDHVWMHRDAGASTLLAIVVASAAVTAWVAGEVRTVTPAMRSFMRRYGMAEPL
ncbi:MAG TPA: hypothetical protein VF665_21790 [Longimicrobium sp.]|uniref:hypothetical protein n=1 Tax=Longimicrobium sp. TaxID=2029185 RepID=UPI002ED86993